MCVQAAVRTWLAGRATARLRRVRLIVTRAAAAVAVQRLVRGFLVRTATRARRVRVDAASRVLQRWWRRTHAAAVAAAAARAGGAARALQRWWRGRVMAVTLRLLRTRAVARAGGMLREEATLIIRQMARRYGWRRGFERGFAAQAARRAALTRLQAVTRGRRGRRRAAALRAELARRAACAPRLACFQRVWRSWLVRLASAAARQRVQGAACDINRVARGAAGRRRAAAVRAAREAAWQRLLRTRPDAAREQGGRPPSPDYGRMFALSRFVRPTAYTAATAGINREAEAAGDARDALTTALTRAAAGSGAAGGGMAAMPARVFRAALASAGARHSGSQITRLCGLFSCGVGGCVSARAYLTFARRQRRLCPLHAVLVCPACLRYGACTGERCACAGFARAGVSALTGSQHVPASLDSDVCGCGHHRRRHWAEVDVGAALRASHASRDAFAASGALATAVRRASLGGGDGGQPGGGGEAGSPGAAATQASRRTRRRNSLEHGLAYVPLGAELRLETSDMAAAQRAEEDAVPARQLALRRRQQLPTGVECAGSEMVMLRSLGGGLVAGVAPSHPSVLALLEGMWDDPGMAAQRRDVHARLTGTAAPQAYAGGRGDAPQQPTTPPAEALARRAPGDTTRAATAVLASLVSVVRAGADAGSAAATARVRADMLAAYAEQDAAGRAHAARTAGAGTRTRVGAPRVTDVTRACDSLPFARQVAGTVPHVTLGTDGKPLSQPGVSAAAVAARHAQEGAHAASEAGDAAHGLFVRGSSSPVLQPRIGPGWSGLFAAGATPLAAYPPAALQPSMLSRSTWGADTCSDLSDVLAELRATTRSVLASPAQRQLAADTSTYLALLAVFRGPGVLPPAGATALTASLDVLADPHRATSLAFAHAAFLRHHWVALIEDVRAGRVQGGPRKGLSPHQRRAAGVGMVPDAGRAVQLEHLLSSLGFRHPPLAARAAGAASGRSRCELPGGATASPYGQLTASPIPRAVAAAQSSVSWDLGALGDGVSTLSSTGTAAPLATVGIPPPGSQLDLTRHAFLYEAGAPRPWLCRVPGCGARFGREAHATQHAGTHQTAPRLAAVCPTDAYLVASWRAAGVTEWLAG